MAVLQAHHLEEDRREEEEEGTLRGIERDESSRVAGGGGHGVVRPLHSLGRSIALLRGGSTDIFPFAHVGAEQHAPSPLANPTKTYLYFLPSHQS